MIKLTMLVKRKNELSYEEFDRYWQEHHSVLVSSVKDVLKIVRYIQNVPFLDKKPDEAMQISRNSLFFDFDGMSEIWWSNLKDMQKARSTPEAKRALQMLLEDENQFIDHSQSLIWYATEREIISISSERYAAP